MFHRFSDALLLIAETFMSAAEKINKGSPRLVGAATVIFLLSATIWFVEYFNSTTPATSLLALGASVFGAACGIMIALFKGRPLSLALAFLGAQFGLMSARISLRRLKTINNVGMLMMKDSGLQFYMSIVLLSAFALFGVTSKDGASIVCSVASLVGIVLFRMITYWRIKKRYFGSEAEEVIEVIEYLSRKSADGGLPPGATMSLYASHETRTREVPSNLAGARP